VKVLANAGAGAKGSLDAIGQLAKTDATKVRNNFYADGSIADPSKAMSATGPWKSVAELSPQEANALIASRIPAGGNVTGASSADAANAAAIADKYQAPFVPGTGIVEVVTTQPTKFVRLFGGDSSQSGFWVMRAEDIAGLTPQQIASKYSLPQVPTMVTDVTIPAGTKLNVSAANSISPNASKGVLTGDNVGGGGVQFQIPRQALTADTDTFKMWFTNPRPLK
jgi:filamentous hemagglutinin